MKNVLYYLLFISVNCFSQTYKNCGSTHLPIQFEEVLETWNNNQSQQKIMNSPITIPVVIHVIHYGEPIGVSINISNSQIQSQLIAVNEDFLGLNADSANVPGLFKSNYAHCNIQFCLAKYDPNGNLMPEEGVNRINILALVGGVPGPYTIDYINTTIKPATIWNPNLYLNIWCLELGDGFAGYATFPDPGTSGVIGLDPPYGSINTDGVVVKTDAFGTTGTAVYPFNGGRTLTHEIGHWLGLRHIWGDSQCGNDYCNDTPEAQAANTGCPVHPFNIGICSNNTTGEMFMNYMDYSDDYCLNMFTNDQKNRMLTILNNSPLRINLKNSSVCSSPSAAFENKLTQQNIKLFPNFITNSEFCVELETQNNQIVLEVYNSVGQIIQKENLDKIKNVIDFSNQKSGIYFVRLSQQNKIIYNSKIINLSFI